MFCRCQNCVISTVLFNSFMCSCVHGSSQLYTASSLSILYSIMSHIMQAQWKQKCENCNSDACIFVPGSTVNEGRNALWAELLRLFPGTIFTYIILLDGEHRLSFRPQHVHTQYDFLGGLAAIPLPRQPYFVWEQVCNCVFMLFCFCFEILCRCYWSISLL